jgi:uncharacterized protein YihD (DUF1040 family)
MEDVTETAPETDVEVPDLKTQDDVVKFLGRNEDSESKTEIEPEPEKEQEQEQEKEPEQEEQEGPLEAKDLVARIKTQDPKFFKNNPQVRDAIYKSAAYDRLFANPDEARQLTENFRNFEKLAGQIMQGNSGELISSIVRTNPASLREFARNFPLALYNQDKETFYDQVAIPITRSMLKDALNEAARTENNNLTLSVKHLSQYLFGSPNLPEEQKRTEDPEKRRLQDTLNERDEFDYERSHQDTQRPVNEQIYYELVNSTPKDSLDGVKHAYAAEVVKLIHDTLMQDRDHMNRMDLLWKRYRESGYDGRVQKQIQDTFINKAKILAPHVIARVRPSYFGKQAKDTSKAQIPAGGNSVPGSSKGRIADPKKIDWKRTRDIDILNGTATYKK